MKEFSTEAQRKLEELLKEMSSQTNIKSKKVDNYYYELVQIYENDNLRHSYSKITDIVITFLKNKNRDKVTLIVEYLDAVLEKAESENQKNTILCNRVLKLIDHINLEVYRYDFYSGIAGDSFELSQRIEIAKQQLMEVYDDCTLRDDITNLTNKSSELESTVQRAEKLVDNLNLQLVSVLGIFASIIIAFFGGFSFFTSVFNNIDQRMSKIVMVASLVGFIVFNLIVFLISSISFIINKPIPLITFDKSRINQKTFYKCVFWLVNVILIIMMIVSLLIFYKAK